MTQQPDIWVDFNGVGDEGHMVALERFAATGVWVVVGAVLVSADHEGRACEVVVVAVGEEDGAVELELRGEFFRIDAEAAGSRVLVT